LSSGFLQMLEMRNANAASMDDVYWYYCLSDSRVNKGACPGVMTKETALLNVLTDMLIVELDAALGKYVLHLEGTEQQAALYAELSKKLADHRQELTQLHGLVHGSYENMVQGILSKDDYFSFKVNYETKIAEVEPKIEQLEQGLRFRFNSESAWIKSSASSFRKSRNDISASLFASNYKR